MPGNRRPATGAAARLRHSTWHRRTGALVAGWLCAASALAVDASPKADSAAGSQAWHARYSDRIKRSWGIDIAGVHPVSSGYMLRLSYRVLDTARASPLFDERARPYLIDAKSGARLAVPAMENIGALRQTARPVADRTYFMIFGNPGKLVARGDHVSIVIGDFRADEIVVD